jgi:hypothetical protein
MVRAWYYDLNPEFAAPLEAKFGAHAIAKPIIAAPGENKLKEQGVCSLRRCTLCRDDSMQLCFRGKGGGWDVERRGGSGRGGVERGGGGGG